MVTFPLFRRNSWNLMNYNMTFWPRWTLAYWKNLIKLKHTFRYVVIINVFIFLICFCLSSLSACSFIKQRLRHRCLPINFAKIFGTAFLQKSSGPLFPAIVRYIFIINFMTAILMLFISHTESINLTLRQKNKKKHG